MESQLSDTMTDAKAKTPVVRGARACTVCRAAKMKCVGAEDGQPCQRCKRANAECIFEKHRRGRKPGSKLSEASKMLRRLEKGLNSAKMKSQSSDPGLASPYQNDDPRNSTQDAHYGSSRSIDSAFTGRSHVSPNVQSHSLNAPYQNGYSTSNSSRTMEIDEEEEDPDRGDEAFFPDKLIKQENQRNSFFRTILNPEETPATTTSSNRGNSYTPPQAKRSESPPQSRLNDPISEGIMDEHDAHVIFDFIFLRLNPFINMFDPSLHSVPYVRSKCPFLFTTLLMAGCKFFKPDLFKQCQKRANEFAVLAFQEQWKRVEVVQAFACLTYWRDPDDNRTWMYIGYACRMAVELNLNHYVPNPPSNETNLQRLERRNRERTYLILFVHDRSLSVQTGRHPMLPEDDLVRNSSKWHEQDGGQTRPEDVIISAFVALRRIASGAASNFSPSMNSTPGSRTEIDYDNELHNCNEQLAQWDKCWKTETERAGGQKFHLSFLSFFRSHVRLFLNSFAIQASRAPGNRHTPSSQAFNACRVSALESLRIASIDFASMGILRYGQDSITVMTAYSAVFLLKLYRSSVTYPQLTEQDAHEIYTLISNTAKAYYDASLLPAASLLSPASTNAAYHARFLSNLVANGPLGAMRRNERHENGLPIDPRLQGPSGTNSSSIQNSPSDAYPHQVHPNHGQSFNISATPLSAHPHPIHDQDYHLDIRNSGAMNGDGSNGPVHHHHPVYPPAIPHHSSSSDAHYWSYSKNMYMELGGFGENGDPNSVATTPLTSDARNMPQYHNIETHHPHQSHPQHHHQTQHQGQFPYHHMHSSQPNYGH